MKSLRKTMTIPIRYSPEDWRRAQRAARIVSKQRGQNVGVSTLLREQANRGVEEILSRAIEVPLERRDPAD